MRLYVSVEGTKLLTKLTPQNCEASGKARTYQAQIAGDVSAQDKPAPDQLHLKKKCSCYHAAEHG